MSDKELREHLTSEVHQFTSLVRARIAQAVDAEATDDPHAGDQHMEPWNDIYGRIVVELQPGEDLANRVGQIMFAKVNAAALVAVRLAVELSELTNLTPIEVVDRIERTIAEDEPCGGDGI